MVSAAGTGEGDEEESFHQVLQLLYYDQPGPTLSQFQSIRGKICDIMTNHKPGTVLFTDWKRKKR